MWEKLKQGLARTREAIAGELKVFLHGKIDTQSIEETLIMADISQETTAFLTSDLKDAQTLLSDLTSKTISLLKPCEKTLSFDSSRLNIVLVVGVNGSGKTTTLAKLGRLFKGAAFVAADTFRAAAVEQLEFWGNKTGIPVYKGKPGQDPASVVYQSILNAQKDGAKVLFIDTAGRLHNKQQLMDELSKIQRVIQKFDESAPHETILILDATVGMNALKQIEVFNEMLGVTGVVMAKLDGTAKGGMLLSMAHKFKLPIYYLGVGEKEEDLEVFNAEHFSETLFNT